MFAEISHVGPPYLIALKKFLHLCADTNAIILPSLCKTLFLYMEYTIGAFYHSNQPLPDALDYRYLIALSQTSILDHLTELQVQVQLNEFFSFEKKGDITIRPAFQRALLLVNSAATSEPCISAWKTVAIWENFVAQCAQSSATDREELCKAVLFYMQFGFDASTKLQVRWETHIKQLARIALLIDIDLKRGASFYNMGKLNLGMQRLIQTSFYETPQKTISYTEFFLFGIRQHPVATEKPKPLSRLEAREGTRAVFFSVTEPRTQQSSSNISPTPGLLKQYTGGKPGIDDVVPPTPSSSISRRKTDRALKASINDYSDRQLEASRRGCCTLM